MKAFELHNRLKKYGLSVKGGIISDERREVVGIYTTYKNDVEEISATPEADDIIANAILE